jgi:hypothetical protein
VSSKKEVPVLKAGNAMVLLPAYFMVGCSLATPPPDTRPAFNQPSQKEISFFKQEAESLNHRIRIYEDLFGPESDWVRGTRLLERFYEELARKHERFQSTNSPTIMSH